MLLCADGEIEVVGEVGDGIQALEAAGRLQPDVVVMDVRMPVMDGVKATWEITHASDAGGQRKPPPVLMLTTYNLDQAIYAALCAGASGFLLKDAAPADLLAAVHALAAGKGWLDPKVTRVLIKEFAGRAGGLPPAPVLELAGVAEPGLAEPPGETPPRRGTFRLTGDFWSVSLDGEGHHLKDSIGLRYLRQLLASPGSEMHVLDLVGSAQGDGDTSSAKSRFAARNLGHAGPALDSEAKAQYRRRIAELQEELEEAESWSDSGRASRAREDLEALAEQLARSTGLGGRDRLAASASERARISVTKAVKGSIRRIEREDPALGRHLRSAVRTGVFCSYSPEDPDIRWEF